VDYRGGVTIERAETVEEPAPIRAVYRLAPREYTTAVRVLSQRSRAAWAMAVVFTIIAGWSIAMDRAYEDPIALVLGAGVPLFFAFGFVSGWYCVPLCWYAIRRRPELFSAEMTFEMDDAGLHYQTAMYDSRVAWPYVRRVRDLGRFLFFDNGAGANMFVPERVFDPESLAAVRRKLGERGLLAG
jgi:hypothetical protein